MAAVSLLTRLPLRRNYAEPGSAAFGIVGVLLGLLAAVTVIAVGDQLPLLAAVGPPAVLTILTGALHLDGLSDTADALAARYRAAARPTRIGDGTGPAGISAVVLTVLAQVVAIASICGIAGALVAGAAVIAATAASRGSAVIGAVILDRVGEDAGGSGWLIGQTSPADAMIASGTALAVALALALGMGTVVPAAAALAALGAGALICVGIRRLRGFLDGDGLGATIEISLALGLVAAALATLLA